MTNLTIDDLNRIVELLVRVSDPTSATTDADRRAMLFAGIAELIDADFWNYVTGISNPDVPGDAMLTRSLDGGFRSEKERADFFRISLHPELAGVVQSSFTEAMATGNSIAKRRCDMVSDANWRLLPVNQECIRAGFDDFILAACPRANGHSGLGFHRRFGKSKFSLRELHIVEYLFAKVVWIHLEPRSAELSHDALTLSPRERQVLVLLLDGASRTQIAGSLQLSVHTVVDYLKSIYKKFGVGGHKQLLARFNRDS